MKLARFALFLPLLSACTSSVFKVSDVPGSGIPFLPVVSVDATELTFEQRWAEIEIWTTYLPEAGGPRLERQPLTARQIRFVTDIAYASGLWKTMNEQSTPLAAHETLALKLANDPDGKLALVEPPQLPIGEVLKLTPVEVARRREQVPGPTPLYLNAPLPFGGSSSPGLELRPDGTLAGLHVETVDALPRTAIETAGQLTMALVAGPAAAADAGGVPIVGAGMRLDFVRRLYTVTVRRPSGDTRPCDVAALLRVETVGRPPPEAQSCSASFAVTVVRGQPGNEGREDEGRKPPFADRNQRPPRRDRSPMRPPGEAPPWEDESPPWMQGPPRTP